MLGRSNQHPYGLNKNQLEQLSTEELEELLRLDFDEPEHNALSTDDILCILDVIEKRECSDQAENTAEVERAWESFQKNYMPTGGDKDSWPEEDMAGEVSQEDYPAVQHRSPRHRVFRSSLIAAIIVLLSLMLAAQAAGINLFKLFGTWTEETFHLASGADVIENQEPVTAKNSDIKNDAPEDKIEYASLSEALTDNGISADSIPSWWPTGFALDELSVSRGQDMPMISALYKNGDKSFTVFIRILTAKTDDPMIYEKDGDQVITYEKNGITHYIMSNNNTMQAVWARDSTVYSISGQLTTGELKKMIASIYER